MMIYIKRQSLADDHLLPLIPCHRTPLTLNKPNCHHFCHCNVVPSCFRMCIISSIQFLNARAPVCLYVCACLYVCVALKRHKERKKWQKYHNDSSSIFIYFKTTRHILKRSALNAI